MSLSDKFSEFVKSSEMVEQSSEMVDQSSEMVEKPTAIYLTAQDIESQIKGQEDFIRSL